ncbi:MAG: DUF2934 domain-containing protein [Planctomycetota bacterium]|nr:MAG: DUF2934 domain-containing protein [Planctomycetota bacterium]
MADNQSPKPTRRAARTRKPKSTAPRARSNKTTARKSARSATASPATATRSAGTPRPTRPPVEHVRERAYYIYLERQCAPGDPVADWIRAEQELASGKFS